MNYHKSREGFLEGCHRFVMLIVLMSGSSAASIFAKNLEVSAALAFLAAFVGALDMTFAFAQKARDHAILAAKFLDVVADLGEACTLAEIQAIDAQFHRICAEEPPHYEAVAALAYNQALAIDENEDMSREVKFLYRRLRHFIRFSEKSFPKPNADSSQTVEP